jgi:sortase A
MTAQQRGSRAADDGSGTKTEADFRDGKPKIGAGKIVSALWLPYLIVLLVIAGLTMLIYPSAAQWLSQYNYERTLNNYTAAIAKDTVTPDEKEQLAAAKAYNDALISGAQLLPNHRIPSGSGTLSASGGTIKSGGRTWTYDQILAADSTGLIGKIQIPKIDVDLPIYHGTSDETLLKGAGHLEGTSLPIGGKSTRTVITAHRGLASAELFTRLNEIKKGDEFTLQVFGKVLMYRVVSTRVIDPKDTAAIKAVKGKDLATLITCTPLGINTQRILVTGERVVPTPKNAAKKLNLPKFPWFFVGYCLGLILLIVWAVYQTRSSLRRLHDDALGVGTKDSFYRPTGSRGMHLKE